MLRPSELLPTFSRNRDIESSEIKALAQNIATNGIVEPLTVRKKEDGRYELITGERRLKAAVLAGLRRVPCVLHKVGKSEAAVLSACENFGIRGFNIFEKARVLDSLKTKYMMSETEVAVSLGITAREIRNTLKFLEFEAQEEQLIRSYSFTEKQALYLLRLPKHLREGVIEEIISKHLGERETAEYIQNILFGEQGESCEEESREQKEKTPVRRFAIGDIRLFSNSLEKLIATLKGAGIKTSLHRLERPRYTEYRIRIAKNEEEILSAEQLKIC